jgi:hypothetical protein
MAPTVLEPVGRALVSVTPWDEGLGQPERRVSTRSKNVSGAAATQVSASLEAAVVEDPDEHASQDTYVGQDRTDSGARDRRPHGPDMSQIKQQHVETRKDDDVAVPGDASGGDQEPGSQDDIGAGGPSHESGQDLDSSDDDHGSGGSGSNANGNDTELGNGSERVNSNGNANGNAYGQGNGNDTEVGNANGNGYGSENGNGKDKDKNDNGNTNGNGNGNGNAQSNECEDDTEGDNASVDETPCETNTLVSE